MRLKNLYSCKHRLLSWKKKDESEGRIKNPGSSTKSRGELFLGRNEMMQVTTNICPVQYQKCNDLVLLSSPILNRNVCGGYVMLVPHLCYVICISRNALQILNFDLFPSWQYVVQYPHDAMQWQQAIVSSQPLHHKSKQLINLQPPVTMQPFPFSHSVQFFNKLTVIFNIYYKTGFGLDFAQL